MTRLALVLAVGCATPVQNPDPPHATGLSTNEELQFAPTAVSTSISDTVPTVVFARFSTAAPTTGFIEYGLDDWVRHTPTSALSTEHEITLLGLKAGHTYQWRPVAVAGDGATATGTAQTIELAAPPAELPEAVLRVAMPERMTDPDGFVAVNLRGASSWVVVLDMDGDPVWFQRMEPGQQAISVKPDPARAALSWVTHHDDDQLLPGGITRVSLDGRERTYTEARFAHHDFAWLPSGDLAWIAYELDEADLGSGLVPVVADAIVEGPVGAVHGSRRVFSFFDDYPSEPFASCWHSQLGQFVDGHHEWTHSNSLIYSQPEDAYYLMVKTLDALLKIDRSGGQVWQLGGRDSDFTLVGDGQLFDHSHMSEAWPGGFAMFDNRVHAAPNVSRAVIYEVDEGARTVRETWSYDEPSGRQTGRLGDVRRMASGNVLVAWGGLARISEITEEGELVWEVAVPDAQNTGRARFLDDLYAPAAP